MLSRFATRSARPRLSWLLTSCALVPFLSLAEPALAGCTGTTDVTCDSGGNPYASGISVSSFHIPISVTLLPGAEVDITDPTVARAVALDSTSGGAPGTGGTAILFANNAAITINTKTNDTSALVILADGDATIGNAGNPVSGIINVTGASSTNGIWAQAISSAPGATASVTYAGPTTGPGITETGGPNSTLIQACASDGCELSGASGNAFIDAAGNLTGFGVDQPAQDTGMNGLFAAAGGGDMPGEGPGDATVNYHQGTIDITQTGPGIVAGIFASSGDVGSATITTDPGTTVMVSGQGSALFGIDAFASGGDATADVASTILVNGNLATPTTSYRRNPTGIIATTDPNAPTDPIGSVSVTYTGSGITVNGGGGLGIVAVAGSVDDTTASGSVTVNASGPIVAGGSNAVGILADSGTVRNTFRSSSSLPTTMTELVQITASNVSAQGQYGVGISATGGSGGVAVNVPSGGSLLGGWQPDVTSVGVTYGLPAAGVILGSSTGSAMLTNDGSIGALSDRAIASPLPASPLFPFTSNNTTIINNGTITGFVQLVGGNNDFVNNGTFDVRHFADTTGATDSAGNAVRDTVRVAVTNLGAGPNNTFENNGTLALGQVTGATKLQSGGQYLPVANTSLGNFSNAMALNGPLQGQILGVATFINSGVIDLQSNPAAGDVLVISGTSSTVNPLSSATSFPGTYISNGGSLLLDTVLNQGGAATISDTLVVDGASVGPKGATQIGIRDPAQHAQSALTVGDGILVVEVLEQSRSAAGAFALANGPIEAGPFEYMLFHGGLQGSNPGDWFLRSDFITPPTTPEMPPTEPSNPLPPQRPPDRLPEGILLPIIGPDLATYGVVQPLARQLGLITLGTLHQRIGDTYGPDCSPPAATAPDQPIDKPGPADCPLSVSSPVWARFFGGTINDQYQAFADPRANGYFWGFQGGVDLLRGALKPGHYDRAGLYMSYDNTDESVDGLVTNPSATAYIHTRTGSVGLDAWSFAGYWTHVGPAGWYLDTIVQGSFYSGHSATTLSSVSIDGTGFLASLEAGYPIPLKSWHGLVLEPQGQIIWQHVAFDHANDAFQSIDLGSTSGTTGRLGLLAESTFVSAGGEVWEPYARANVWASWGGRATTLFGDSPIPVSLNGQATWLEFAGGGTVKVNARWSGFAQAGYQFAVAPSNVRRNGFTGDIGLRYTW